MKQALGNIDLEKLLLVKETNMYRLLTQMELLGIGFLKIG
jgi:hypothetical protein